MREKGRRQGSYTIEAALVLPMILMVLAAVMVTGFRSAQSLGLELQEIRQEYVQNEVGIWSEKLRKEQAVVDGFWEE